MSFIPSSKVTSNTPNGSNTAPAFSFSNDNDTGLYSISDGVLGITTNAVLALSINSSQQLSLNSHKIISLLDPTSAQDAATKIYVDNVAAGLDVKTAVRVATTANLVAIAIGSGVGKTLTAVSNGAISVDGTSLSLNDRVLVKNQTISKDNGIYTVTTVGTGGTPYILTRATDFDGSPANEVQGGDFCFVEVGTQGGSGWTVIFNGNIVVDTDNITWTQFNATASYIADESTLHLSGNTFSIKSGFSPIFAANGVVGAPAYSFSGDATTGIYRSGGGSLAFSVGGSLIYGVNATSVSATVPFLAADGTAGSPGITFSAQANTGIYRSAAGRVSIATGGAEQFRVDSANGIEWITGQLTGADGTVSLPAYSFNNGTAMGMYRIGTNILGLATAGTEAFRIDASQKIGVNTTNTSANYQMRIDATNRLGISIVSQASASAAYLFLENNGGNTWNFACDGTSATLPNYFELAYNGTTAFQIDPTGEVINFVTVNGNASKQFSTRNAGTGYSSFTTVNTPSSMSVQVGTAGSAATGSWFTGVAAANSTYIQSNGSSAGLILQTSNSTPISFGTNNLIAMQLDSGQHALFTDGAIGAPGISFISDTNTGFWRSAADSLQIVAGGANVIAAFSNGCQLFARDGSVGSPSIAFNSSNNTGLFWTSGSINFAVTGVIRSVIDTTGVYGLTVRGNNGTVGAPTFTFDADQDTGMYHSNTNNVALAAGGSQVFNGQATQIDLLGSQTNFFQFDSTTPQVTPRPSATWNLGSATFKFNAAWVVTLNTGDIAMQNDWKITEGDKVGHPEEGIMFVSPSGKKYKIAMTEVE